MIDPASPPLSRRGEYAAATRQAILDAARRLFSERGYFSTKVDEIAAMARVSPATVYALWGGKHGLLCTLTKTATRAPAVAATIDSIQQMDDPAAILRLVAESCRKMSEEFGDIVRVLLATAPHDEAVSRGLANATTLYRQSFKSIAQRLAGLGALRDGFDVNDTVDVLWFYFGYSSLIILHDDNGWSYERAGQWLCHEASRALLREPATLAPE